MLGKRRLGTGEWILHRTQYKGHVKDAPVSYTHLDVYKRQGLVAVVVIAKLLGATPEIICSLAPK